VSFYWDKEFQTHLHNFKINKFSTP